MTIEVLFPEVANLYGDLGNIEYITRSLEACGKTCEVIDTDLYTRPAFADRDDIDLIYMGPVTEKGQLRVIDSDRMILKKIFERTEKLVIILRIFPAAEPVIPLYSRSQRTPGNI